MNLNSNLINWRKCNLINGWKSEPRDIVFRQCVLGERGKKEVKSFKDLLNHLGIEKVIFNDNATIVYLTTGEKGVAIRSQTEEFDPVIGLSVAYALAESGISKKKFKELINKAYKRGGKK